MNDRFGRALQVADLFLDFLDRFAVVCDFQRQLCPVCVTGLHSWQSSLLAFKAAEVWKTNARFQAGDVSVSFWNRVLPNCERRQLSRLKVNGKGGMAACVGQQCC